MLNACVISKYIFMILYSHAVGEMCIMVKLFN